MHTTLSRKPLQHQASTQQTKAAPTVSARLNALHGPTPLHYTNSPLQLKSAQTLPPQLRDNMQAMSGVALDNVQVHYNSPQAAQMGAEAFAQGQQIHLGPGREKHLPHEAWHLVQQAQGRVPAQFQMSNGQTLNTDPALEQEADRMGARAATANLSTSPAASKARLATRQHAPRQAVFNMVRKKFTTQKDVLDSKAQLLRKHSLKTGLHENDIVAKAIQMAESGSDFGRFKSYIHLYSTIVELIQKDKALTIPTVTSAKIKTGRATVYKRDGLTGKIKLVRLKNLQKWADKYSLKDSGVRKFRDTSKMARLKSKTYKKREYSIGHTGNFLLGGVTEHDYKELFAKAKQITGKNDKEVGQMLLAQLSGTGDAFKGYNDSAIDYLLKITGLMLGPEFRRSSFNVIATFGALNQAIEGGADLYQTLRDYALYVASEKDSSTGGLGGSKRSQFHTIAIDEEQSDFKKVAQNQYDSFMELAEVNGVDIKDEKALKAFVYQLTQTGIEGLQQSFTF